MYEHPFPHELNPEGRRRKALEGDREKLAAVGTFRARLLSRFRKLFVRTAPLPLAAALWPAGPRRSVENLLVSASFGLTPHLFAILLCLFRLGKRDEGSGSGTR